MDNHIKQVIPAICIAFLYPIACICMIVTSNDLTLYSLAYLGLYIHSGLFLLSICFPYFFIQSRLDAKHKILYYILIALCLLPLTNVFSFDVGLYSFGNFILLAISVLICFFFGYLCTACAIKKSPLIPFVISAIFDVLAVGWIIFLFYSSYYDSSKGLYGSHIDYGLLFFIPIILLIAYISFKLKKQMDKMLKMLKTSENENADDATIQG